MNRPYYSRYAMVWSGIMVRGAHNVADILLLASTCTFCLLRVCSASQTDGWRQTDCRASCPYEEQRCYRVLSCVRSTCCQTPSTIKVRPFRVVTNTKRHCDVLHSGCVHVCFERCSLGMLTAICCDYIIMSSLLVRSVPAVCALF